MMASAPTSRSDSGSSRQTKPHSPPHPAASAGCGAQPLVAMAVENPRATTGPLSFLSLLEGGLARVVFFVWSTMG